MKFILGGILWNLAGLLAAIILAYYLAESFRAIYCITMGTCTGGFFGFDLGVLRWGSFGYIFFISLLLTSIGARMKYWWIGVALIPAALFEILIDPLHIYIPVILGLIACGLGTMVNKALWKLAPRFMAKIG